MLDLPHFAFGVTSLSTLSLASAVSQTLLLFWNNRIAHILPLIDVITKTSATTQEQRSRFDLYPNKTLTILTFVIQKTKTNCPISQLLLHPPLS
jgi:hypothetical protein